MSRYRIVDALPPLATAYFFRHPTRREFLCVEDDNPYFELVNINILRHRNRDNRYQPVRFYSLEDANEWIINDLLEKYGFKFELVPSSLVYLNKEKQTKNASI